MFGQNDKLGHFNLFVKFTNSLKWWDGRVDWKLWTENKLFALAFI